MISRPLYLEKIRPFMNTDVVKVLTGIRRCGKSVMLELIQKELVQNGIAPSQIIATSTRPSRILSSWSWCDADTK